MINVLRDILKLHKLKTASMKTILVNKKLPRFLIIRENKSRKLNK